MAHRTLTGVLQFVRSLVGDRQDAVTSDDVLLRRFAGERDEMAFTALLQRHGPMVWGVCRHILREGDAAEDAFQATFLVLARKAASVQRQQSLSVWLYRVATNVSLNARKSAARRHDHERQVAIVATSANEAASTESDWQPALHEEVNLLPSHYRSAIVLCYLRGKTNEEAAHELGWPVGTVKGRLSRARDLLRDRLLRRGVALPAGLPAVVLTGTAVPATLADETVRTAMQFAAAGSGGTATAAVALAETALKGMVVASWKIAAAVAVAALLLGGTAAWLWPFSGAAERVVEAPASAAPPAPAVASPTDLYGDPLPAGALARFGTVRWRVSGVNRLLFTRQSKYLVTAASDGSIRTWEASTGRELRNLATKGDITAVAADGQLAASAHEENGLVRLWDLGTGKELRSLQVADKGDLSALAFAPDGKTLTCRGPDKVLRLWDVGTRKEVRNFGETAFDTTDEVRFSPDGRRLLLTTVEYFKEKSRETGATVRVWDIATGKELCRVQRPCTDGMPPAFLPDGNTFVWVSCWDTTIGLYETATGKELRRLGKAETNGDSARSFVVLPGGKQIALAPWQKGTIEVWDLATGKLARQLGTPAAESFRSVSFSNGIFPQALAVTPDGKVAALVQEDRHRLRLWDLTTGQEQPQANGHLGGVSALAFAADGQRIVSRGTDNSVRQWHTTTGKEQRQFELPDTARFVAYSPDGQLLAFGGTDRSIRLWDVAAGKEIRQLSLPGPESGQWVADLAFAPGGKLLAAQGTDESLCVWDVASGREVRRLAEPVVRNKVVAALSSTSPCLTFDPSGTLLSTTRSTKSDRDDEPETQLLFWSLAGGRIAQQTEKRPKNVTALAFAADGRSAAAGHADGIIYVWELATGKERSHFRGGHTVLAFSPDGRLLAAGGEDHTIHIWDTARGKELGTLTGHRGMILALRFTADGTKLVSGSEDTTALVWDLADLRRRLLPDKQHLADKKLEASWKDLASADPAPAFQAAQRLQSSPEQSVAWIQQKLQPAPAVDGKLVDKLIGDLDSGEFSVRQKARAELERLGGQAEPALRKALAAGPPLDTGKQLEQLLERLGRIDVADPEDLRALRSVELLEQIGIAEARETLKKLAAGAEGSRITREARQSLERLAKLLSRQHE